jgi:glycosyltransferase involved in cell wall biosynthesis
MGHGVPLVLSDIPIFREIAQDAALYFDPTRPELFANKVRELEKPGKWSEISARSVDRGSFFDWDKSASLLLEVLGKL